MRMTYCIVLPLWLLSCIPASAADWKVLPSSVALTGPHASQRVIFVSEESGKVVADRTPDAKFISSQPAVATVDQRGVVRPVSDGDAIITASHGEKQAAIPVKVSGMKQPAAFSFTNDVIPLLTKVGCNSGAVTGRWPARAD